MFNPRATLDVVRFDDGRFCVGLDDALLEPARLVQYAAEHRSEFRSVDFNAYPGIYLLAPPDLTRALNEVFRLRIRNRFDARRCVVTHCRLSMVTLPPDTLSPIQWLCHADDSGLDARLSIPACVLYLFSDADLGDPMEASFLLNVGAEGNLTYILAFMDHGTDDIASAAAMALNVDVNVVKGRTRT